MPNLQDHLNPKRVAVETKTAKEAGYRLTEKDGFITVSQPETGFYVEVHLNADGKVMTSAWKHGYMLFDAPGSVVRLVYLWLGKEWVE